ncbi:hypothetical protein BRC63_04730 [Halobacteriales archaeon QH_10_70_21]|nr:MAG: hypothetical protein BRC63_04730 [Halobacteriales archaeon QH_10_70_21]
MTLRTPLLATVLVVAVLSAGCVGPFAGDPTPAATETADRYTGLSETDDLPGDRGMLFTYDADRELTYVMRNMSFALDIVFVYGNGTIESIHHKRAPAPGEDGESIRAAGEGRYVLEVNRGWTTERGVEEGDRLEFDRPE